jgi:hypothetical protein
MADTWFYSLKKKWLKHIVLVYNAYTSCQIKKLHVCVKSSALYIGSCGINIHDYNKCYMHSYQYLLENIRVRLENGTLGIFMQI